MSSSKESSSMDAMEIDSKFHSSSSDDRNNNNNLLLKKKCKDDSNGDWHCPVCNIQCDSQHSFTVHIRQHNPTDHSHTCSICGKTLSSASSLDRHMLIHSGERPFKCRICNMAFTTNGNMHRHMRTHTLESSENDSPASNNTNDSTTINNHHHTSITAITTPKTTTSTGNSNNHHTITTKDNNNKIKGRKRKMTQDSQSDGQTSSTTASSSPASCNDSPKTKVYTDGETGNVTPISASEIFPTGRENLAARPKVNTSKEELYQLCDRRNSSSSSSSPASSPRPADKFNLNSPLTPSSSSPSSLSHPIVDSIHCKRCGMSLPNQASLSSHNCINMLVKSGPKSGSNGHHSIGFHDLTFTDFSSRKYPLIAKSFCEHNIRKSSSPYHDFECIKCSKAFPCSTSLHLHQQATHTTDETYCHICRIDLGTPVLYLSHQATHRYESFFSAVNGVNLSSSLFPKALNGDITAAAAAACNGAGNGGIPTNKDHSSNDDNNSFASEKDQFFAMLQLQNKKVSSSEKKDPMDLSRDESNFDYPSYFISAKPSILNGNRLIQPRTPKMINGRKAVDPKELPTKHDLADISSIISVTSSATPLLTNMTSSPPTATPASPIEAAIGSGSSVKSPSHGGQASSPKGEASNNTGKPLDGEVSSEDEERMEIDTENHSSGNGTEKENGTSFEGNVGESKNEDHQTYKCEICSLIFKSFNALKRHNRGHTKGGHNYVCNLCPYTSLDKSTLVRHLRTHNGERPFQCSICKYAFTTKANCERHVRKRHKKLSKPEIKSVMQLTAGLTTSPTSHLTIQNITRHNSIPSNLGEYPGPNDSLCRYCNTDYKNNKVLRHHIRTIHNDLSQKPYSCTLCKMGFSTKNNCIRHARRLHPEMREDLASVVIVNGSSIASHSGSEDISESETGTMDNSITPHHSSYANEGDNNNGLTFKSDISSVDAVTLAQQFHSSLAALCQIAGIVSPIGPDKPLNLASGEGYDGDESNDNADDQPLDLAKNGEDNSNAKTQRSRGKRNEPFEQPLDLAVHALDLSVKSSKKDDNDSSQNQSLIELHKNSEPIRTASSSLLALQSLFPQPDETLLTSSCISINSPLRAHTASMVTSCLPISASLVPGRSEDLPSLASSIASTNSASTTVNIVNTALAPNINGLADLPGNKISLLSKNSRNFTCTYCSAGFTLKSNMERHIKRKHPEFARSSRARAASALPLAPPVAANSLALGKSPAIQAPSSRQQSTNSISNQESNTLLRPVSLLSKPATTSTTTLSNKTRAALRVVLNNKALGSNGNLITEGNNDSTSFPLERSDQELASMDGLNPEANQHEDAGGDLASVSSMIDNTANSSNALKHYFDKAQEGPLESNKNKNNNTEKKSKEVLEQSIRPITKDAINKHKEKNKVTLSINGKVGNSPKSGDQNIVPKKRSAYTDSPNSVSCPYCSRRFPWTSSLRRHILTHTGLKPYKCPKCPILFTTKSNCERHLVRKHDNDKHRSLQPGEKLEIAVPQDNKQYKCNLCPSNYFSTQGNLRKHYYLRHWTKTGKGPSLLKGRFIIREDLVNKCNIPEVKRKKEIEKLGIAIESKDSLTDCRREEMAEEEIDEDEDVINDDEHEDKT